MTEDSSSVSVSVTATPVVSSECTWTPDEVTGLIEGWSRYVDEVNRTRNEDCMQKIADHIGTTKTAKQVRTKLKKLRSQYAEEKQKIDANPGTKSKWRYFSLLNLFGHKICKNPRRRAMESETNSFSDATPNKLPKVQLEGIRENNELPTAVQVSAITGSTQQQATLPLLYPYDPEVPADVVIDSDWNSWNASLQYAMTDSGLRTLLRSGFRDVTHLELLRRKTASTSNLHLNYHDKLALEHALEFGAVKLQQYQVITNDDGTVLEVRGCADADETILLGARGVKMSEWNKSLAHPLTDAGLVKLMKAGFGTPEDVTNLIDDQAVDELDLTLRDKAALRKNIGI